MVTFVLLIFWAGANILYYVIGAIVAVLEMTAKGLNVLHTLLGFVSISLSSPVYWMGCMALFSSMVLVPLWRAMGHSYGISDGELFYSLKAHKPL